MRDRIRRYFETRPNDGLQTGDRVLDEYGHAGTIVELDKPEAGWVMVAWDYTKAKVPAPAATDHLYRLGRHGR